MSSQQIVVVIPVYKDSLTGSESQTMLNNIQQLARYSIHIICPQSLSAKLPGLFPGNVQVTGFDDFYFAGLEGYNKLLRSHHFYARFADYEYMLIAQTDAFIFNSDLEPFCSRGYDYWGAPWLDFELINYKFLRPVLPLFHKSRHLKPFRRVFGPRYLVGNGGLSLRKITTHLEVTSRFETNIRLFEKDYDKWIEGGALSMMEDIFWTLYVPRFYPGYTVAPWQEALLFSFEMYPRKAYSLTGNKLPFGCHAFEKVDPAFYRKFIGFLN